MSKIFTIIIFSILALIVSSQPGPKITKYGGQTSSSTPTWTCAFNFTFDNVTVFSETLSNSLTAIQRTNFSSANNNRIDAFNWAGDSCFCWVLLYEDAFFNDNRVGLWVGTPGGSLLLENFLAEDTDLDFLEEIEVNADNRWNQWDFVLSSYRIYCF